MKSAQVEGDIAEAIKVAPKNAYLFYNRGNLYAAAKNYSRAIDDYSRAIEIDPNFAEAYLNRGLACCYSGKTTDGLHDFSKAGELGLYNAYAISKQLSRKK